MAENEPSASELALCKVPFMVLPSSERNSSKCDSSVADAPTKSAKDETAASAAWIAFQAERTVFVPLWYIPYSKEEAREFLEKKFGWQYYGAHHLENRMTAYNLSAYSPLKFNIDLRNNEESYFIFIIDHIYLVRNIYHLVNIKTHTLHIL